MNFKSNRGFTLVELIVVIAILGILATVTVPAYAGYVEKAEKAMDDNQLALINNVFAVACVDSGVSASEIENAKLSWSANVVDGLESVSGPDAIKTAFATYLAEGGVEFKKYTESDIHYSNGKFSLEYTYTVGYGNGGHLTLNTAGLKQLLNSTFMDEDLGVTYLLDQINQVTLMAQAFDNANAAAIMNEITNSEAFKLSALKAMGITEIPEGKTIDEVLYAECLALADGDRDKAAQIQTNAVVLFASQTATKMNAADITALLTGAEPYTKAPYDTIKGELTGNNGAVKNTTDGLAHASLAYGMYLSWAYATDNTEAIGNTTDPLLALGAMNGMSDTDKASFNAYMNDKDRGQKDLAAYMSALGMISSSAESTEAVKEVLVKGFGDDVLAGVIQGEMDKQK